MLDDLLTAAREAAGPRVWGAAVTLARKGGVQGVSDDGEEVHLQVRAPGKMVWHEVYLWPGDADWGCDCDLPGDCCVHAAAAVIALQQSRREGEALPAPTTEQQIAVRYAFSSNADALSVKRIAKFTDGSQEVITRPLVAMSLVAGRVDVQAETHLALHTGGPLRPDQLRTLLAILEPDTDATLDDAPVRIGADPIPFRVRVRDDGEGFHVQLVRPKGLDRLFRGAALADGVLSATSHGELTPEQRKALVAGVKYGPDEVASLVSEVIPSLRRRAPVDVETDRLPDAGALVPKVQVTLEERPEGLSVGTQIVYGDPPVAKVTAGNQLTILSDAVVPARDPGAERQVARAFQERTGIPVGFPRLLPPDEAVMFLRDQVPRHGGPVRGQVDPQRFRVREQRLLPHLDVREVDGEWELDVAFRSEGDDPAATALLQADPLTVIRAWQANRSLVPLLDGGFAPLPTNWLAEHGALLLELLEARDGRGRVGRHSTAALVELLEDTAAEVPPNLHRLRTFLEGGEGLPEVEPPAGLRADLRPYQRAGLQWLRFLRDMTLSGILADDMGLGKTVQALAAMLDAGGRHLVVAPTSVISNWAREAARFAPELKVCVFHGPQRRLDPEAHLTITSYALLRLDRLNLRDQGWTYVVLDEAQAIKNPTSQTAQAAYDMRSEHRLALTGTPVENRLEELWSLFRFLMPGLLGSESAFKERFSRPIETGDHRARTALRARVRPYVLRRLKQQVATELPPLTEIVERCPLETQQRRVYESVRLTARQDVQAALSKGTGSTMQVLEALLRMRQACCDPALLPGTAGHGAGAAKLDRMEEILVEVVAEGHRALVFSQWTSLLDRVEERLAELGIQWARLDGGTRNRQEVIDTFQADDGPPVFLLSLKAGGFGLNLTAADYVLHLDPWWNPAVERQATDRAHRIGQERPVVSIKLVAENTVEDRILDLQAAKRDLADAALGTEGGFLRALSAAELRSLFEEA
ncbi:MAG: DEAD/DEAH box helicase [Myxococcales bacterium]|nr:DEAD/DEAH box helicase [Myxococcales bacterium]